MKKIFFLIVAVSSFFNIHAQNVGIGTTTPAGKLHIKGSADTSQLTIDANAIQTNAHPLIRLRNSLGQDLLHISSDYATNTFIGFNTGRFSRAQLSGGNNTFMGAYAGYSTDVGTQNTATGGATLYSNTFGSFNTANGYEALFANTTGDYNTAVGENALFSNTTGSYNAASGLDALNRNTTGVDNTAYGVLALFHNITGNYNTACGYSSLYATTNSWYNTAVGCNAGITYDNGYNNVFIGANVDVNGPGYYNVIAIGQGTVVSGPSAAVFGNPATASYSGYANWSNISDVRYKKNIRENVPGLDFITKLRPITYNIDATSLDAFLHKNDNKERKMADAARMIHNKALQEKEAITYTGFSAQEVEATAKQLGFNFSGVDAPKNENGVYGLRYADFVVPLVKAVQEQQKTIEQLSLQLEQIKNPVIVVKQQQMIDQLMQQNTSLEKRISDLEKKQTISGN